MSPGLHEVARSPLLEVPKWRTDNPFPKVLEEGRGDCRLVEAPPSAEISAPGVPTTAGFDDSLALPHALWRSRSFSAARRTPTASSSLPLPDLTWPSRRLALSEGRALSCLCMSTAHPGAAHSSGLSLNAERQVAGRGEKDGGEPGGPTADPTQQGSSSSGELSFGDNYMASFCITLLPFLISTILIQNSNL